MAFTSDQKMFFKFILVFVIIVTLVILIVLLSKRIAHKKVEHYGDNESKGILSFTGGGLIALTADVGVIHGIRRRLTGRLTLNQILDKYQVISSNSGGSWFSTLMIYSPSFFNMLAEGDLTTFDKDCNENPVPNSEKWKTKCGLKGMNTCGDKQCCCKYGSKFNDKNLINKCDLCKSLNPNAKGRFTFEKYIARALQVIGTKTKSDSIVNKIIDFLPEAIGGNYIKPFWYFYNEPWVVVNQAIIFDPVGDMPPTIASNPNKITSHCVWGSTILQNSNLLDHAGYYIGNENSSICTPSDTLVENCGVMLPITFDYNHSSKSSTLGLYGGTFKSNVPIHYYPSFSKAEHHGENVRSFVTVEPYLSRTTSSDISPSDIAACSSAVAALASQTYVIETAVENAIGGGFLQSFLNQGLKRGVKYIVGKITKSFNDFSVPMMLNNSKGKIEIIPKRINTDVSIKNLSSNIYVKTGDGGYFDNSSITNAVRAWQKDGGVGICKIININPPHAQTSFQIDKKNTKTNAPIFNLFGCTGNDNSSRSCVSPTPSHMSKIDFPANVSKIMNKINPLFDDILPFLVPQIFPTQDFLNERCLWWGRCSQDNSKSCSDNRSKCIVEIAITFYRTTTIQNNTTGIISGTPVELYVINVNSTKSDIMLIPGANNQTAGINYLNTAVKTSDLIQKIPEKLFNIMFLDQGDISTYSGDCGTVPKC